MRESLDITGFFLRSDTAVIKGDENYTSPNVKGTENSQKTRAFFEKEVGNEGGGKESKEALYEMSIRLAAEKDRTSRYWRTLWGGRHRFELAKNKGGETT